MDKWAFSYRFCVEWLVLYPVDVVAGFVIVEAQNKKIP